MLLDLFYVDIDPCWLYFTKYLIHDQLQVQYIWNKYSYLWYGNMETTS